MGTLLAKAQGQGAPDRPLPEGDGAVPAAAQGAGMINAAPRQMLEVLTRRVEPQRASLTGVLKAS